MLSLIPPVVAFTIFLGWILFAANGTETDKAEAFILGENMLRYTEVVAKDIESSGSAAGVYDPVMPPPFSELTDWVSEVVDDASTGSKFILTWPVNYVATSGTGDGWTETDYGLMVSELSSARISRTTSGRWQPNGDGSGRVADLDIPILISTIPDRAPTVVYRLN